ncbi:histidine phosphatase family protein [Paenibacillus hamazuiensis]|uniref:histidine phosphatase family protein n=1 Tax=Paenibacillus hamazuiensis TaxID=2936508 RepID=UPI00200DE0B6|nr:histidine phosphatase family protein [Paenibacillus hamazuiensis]
MTRFYIVRHGETEWNYDHNRYCGKTNISISDTGAQQARKTAEFLAGTPLDAIYASTLKRAQETAEPIAKVHGIDVRTDSRLEEVDFGLWEGLRGDEIRSRYPDAWRLWCEQPETNAAGSTGETARQVFERMNSFFEETALHNPDGRILAVSHSTAIRIYLAGVLSMPFRAYRQLVQSNTGIAVVETSSEGMRLTQFNCRYDSFAAKVP